MMNASYAEIILACGILLLPFLYESSQAFRYYLRFFVYYTGAMLFAVMLIPIMCLKPHDIRNFLYGAAFCKYISPIIGLRWTLRGKEHLEQERACIIVSNHQSSLDVLGMFEIWHIMDKCTVIAKKELFYAGPFGIAAWLCGIIFIDRVHSDSARNSVNAAAKIVKQNKAKLWIFPEGTRRNTGEIHNFKKGAFHMAICAQLPILPVVFTSYYFLNKTEKIFDHGNIIMTTLPAISTEGMTVNDIDVLMKQTRDVMIPVFHETTKEVLEYAGRLPSPETSTSG